jgi:hypothetical protein
MVFCCEVDEMCALITAGKSEDRWYWFKRNSMACHCYWYQFVLQLSLLTLLNPSPPVTSSRNSCKVICTRSSFLRSTCQPITLKSSYTRYYEVSRISPLKHTCYTCCHIKTRAVCLHMYMCASYLYELCWKKRSEFHWVISAHFHNYVNNNKQ